MRRIAYPPQIDPKSKENNRQLLMQSYVEKVKILYIQKRYEDIWDESN